MANNPRAKFQITADGSDYKRKLNAAKRDTETFSSSVRGALRAGALAGTAALAGTTVALGRLSEQAAKAAEMLADESDKLGIATEKLAAMQLAARLTGVANEKLTMGLQRMVRRVAEAAQGSGEAVGALKELGLEATELVKLTLDEQFERVAIAMKGVDNQADKIRLGFKLFDSEGVDLIRTLTVMGEDFAAIEREAKAFGVAISRVDAEKIAQAGDAVERAQTATLGIGTNIALAIAPLKGEVANAFADAAKQSQGFKDEINATMRALVVGANFAMNSIRGIQLAILGAKLAALAVQEAFVNEAPKDSVLSKARRFLGGGVAMAAQAFGEQVTVGDTRAEIDETGAAIEALIAKFQSGEQALARYAELQLQAAREAKAAVAEVTGSGTILQPFSLEEIEERQAAQRELLVRHHEETARRIVDIERRRLAKQQALEQQHQSVMVGYRQRAVDTAIGLLHTLGARSKAIAIAAIIAEKAVAITRIIISTNVAAAKALAELGPIAGPPAAAGITAWGYGLAAATAAVGIGQIASLGSGSTGTTIGTQTNPVITESSSQQDEPQQAERVVNINLYGDILTEDRLENVLGNMFGSDRVIISSNSRQAAEIRRGR